MVTELQQLRVKEFRKEEAYWPDRRKLIPSATPERLQAEADRLAGLLNRVRSAVELFTLAPKDRWRVGLIAAGTRGG